MAGDRERTGDWTGDQWARGQSDAADARAEIDAEVNTDPTAGEIDVQTTENAGEDRWNKTQWVGDQGHGAPLPVDPDTMPEGENALSGNRHSPGGEHFATGQADVRSRNSGDRLLDQ